MGKCCAYIGWSQIRRRASNRCWARSCGGKGDHIDPDTRACNADRAQCCTVDHDTRLIEGNDVWTDTAWTVRDGNSDPQPPWVWADCGEQSRDQGGECQCSLQFFGLDAPGPTPDCQSSGWVGGSSQDHDSASRSDSVDWLRSENLWYTSVFEASSHWIANGQVPFLCWMNCLNEICAWATTTYGFVCPYC